MIVTHKGQRGLVIPTGVYEGIVLTDCEDVTIEAMTINGPGVVDAT